MPGFGHNPTPGTRPEQDRLKPFGEEITQFFPEVKIFILYSSTGVYYLSSEGRETRARETWTSET